MSEMKKTSQPNAIDLFAGAGGLSLGLRQAGWNIVAACEYDTSAADTYRKNFGLEKTFGDVREVSWTPYKGKVELLAGGPPCQPFSVAGNQRASGDERDMLPEFVRAVREIQPSVFLMENVAGLVTGRNLPYLQGKIEELEALGYGVSFKVLNASDYGVPQHRKRVIVLGSRSGIPRHPEPTHDGVSQKRVSARSALIDTPTDAPNRAITTYAKVPVLRPSPWAGMLVNGGGRPINLDEPSQTIPASAGGNRTHILDEDGVLLKYHSHLMKGGKVRTGLVQGVRRLTLRESARLQSFPDDFCFLGERSAQYRQVGNAVPPLLAKALGLSLLKSL